MNCEFFTQYRIHPSLRILYTKIKYHWKLEETTSFFLFHCIRKTKTKQNYAKDQLSWYESSFLQISNGIQN